MEILGVVPMVATAALVVAEFVEFVNDRFLEGTSLQ
jgi:hypothetical protein